MINRIATSIAMIYIFCFLSISSSVSVLGNQEAGKCGIVFIDTGNEIATTAKVYYA